jgi:branched-chain amino acid transport system permease protein
MASGPSLENPVPDDAVLKKASVAALLALVLSLPFIGIRLDDSSGPNGLAFRPQYVAGIVVFVFLARLAFLKTNGLAAWRPRWLEALTFNPQLKHPYSTILLALILGLAFTFPLAPITTRYEIGLATSFLIYVMLGWGLNIVVGLAGLLDLGYVAFYAAGAYTFGLLSTYFGVGFWLALPLSGLVAATLGMLLGFPVLRLKGDYLAIVTLGFGEIIRIILINWADLTGGPNGISGITRPSFFGIPFAAQAPDGGTTFAQLFGIPFSPQHRLAWTYYVILVLALLTLAFTSRLRRLPIGRAWEALREDEVACQALGLNLTVIKLTAFSLGAMLGGFAGCFFAAKQGFISPESFTFSESAIILAIVVLGGMGNQAGVVIAAAILVGLPELGRSFAEYRMLVFGAAMVFIMIWRPGGLISGRSPTIHADLAKFKNAGTGTAT